MSKRIFSKGTLVRKTTRWGAPIGDWMEVEMANPYHVYAKYVHGSEIMLFRRERIWKPKMARLAISMQKMHDILDRGHLEISHPVCKSWYAVLQSPPDLITFYTSDGWCKIIATVDTVYCDNYYVKIVIDNVIKTVTGCN